MAGDGTESIDRDNVVKLKYNLNDYRDFLRFPTSSPYPDSETFSAHCTNSIKEHPFIFLISLLLSPLFCQTCFYWYEKDKDWTHERWSEHRNKWAHEIYQKHFLPKLLRQADQEIDRRLEEAHALRELRQRQTQTAAPSAPPIPQGGIVVNPNGTVTMSTEMMAALFAPLIGEETRNPTNAPEVRANAGSSFFSSVSPTIPTMDGNTTDDLKQPLLPK